jgi:predicted nucleic acid-binding Zn ribbon protein
MMAKEKQMSEFRVEFNEANRRRDRRIRLIVWGTIPLLLVATLLGIYGALSSRPHVYATFTWFAVLIVVGAIVGAHFLGIRLGIERLERDIVFLLTEKDLVRRRKGWPDVRIDFSEISALLERKDWLVVESVQPTRRIAIPREVEGFASLRAELAKHSPVIVSQKGSILGAIPTVASLLCWALVLWSKDARVARVAGTIALILLGWASVSIDKQMRQSPKRLFVWISLGLVWAAAILLLYLKVVRT